jgi:hypothetical protein
VNDFRSDPMPSAEGRGRARAAWEAYSRASSRMFRPAVESMFGDAIKSYSAGKISDLVGFWVFWHLYGGFEGLQQLGMSRSSIFRKAASFRQIFGVHPDEFDFPGVSLDVETFLKWTPDDTP